MLSSTFGLTLTLHHSYAQFKEIENDCDCFVHYNNDTCVATLINFVLYISTLILICLLNKATSVIKSCCELDKSLFHAD